MTEADIFKQARRLLSEADTEDGMAQLATMRFVSRLRDDSDMARVLAQVEAGLRADPALATRYDQAIDRIGSIEAAGDARAHFERLTDPGRGARRPREDRRPVKRARPSGLRRAAISGAGVLAIVAAMLLTGRLSEDPLSRIAYQGITQDQVGRVYRGLDDARIQDARDRARNARKRRLGTWIRYDVRELAAAESLLLQVRPSVQTSLLLARIRLIAGDPNGAIQVLESGARGDSAAAALRSRILNRQRP